MKAIDWDRVVDPLFGVSNRDYGKVLRLTHLIHREVWAQLRWVIRIGVILGW